MDSTADHPRQSFFAKTHTVGSLRRAFGNKLLSILCIVLSFLTLVPLVSIIFMLVQKGLPLLSWHVFTELPPAAGSEGGGFGNAIIGTFLMVGIALVLATPFGILSAIYINEYALSLIHI